MRIEERPSPNFDARPSAGIIDMLVLHYTGMKTAAEALDRLCDPAAKVSAHYLIEEDGRVWRLVEEAQRAWHAGVSSWQGRTDINAVSIGIELVNPGHEFGYRPFPRPQIAALETLATDILRRHAIEPRLILGHSDVAPQRKQDPGELFDWEGLAGAGIGFWPDFAAVADGDAPSTVEGLQQVLRRIGYSCSASGAPDAETRAVIAAFQRHYRPSLCDGTADDETWRRIAIVARGI